jgi:hypothetical protein
LKRSREQRFSKQVLGLLAMSDHEAKMRAALALSHEDRLAFFEATRVVHPKHETVLDALDAHPRRHSGDAITLLIGPTGVGKTTIANAFYERTLRLFTARMLKDPGLIPIIKLEAPATGEIRFSHRVFYAKILNELQAPHLSGQKMPSDLERVANLLDHSKGTVGRLRLEVEIALEGRRCEIMMIDEAFHFLGGGGNRLKAQMDGLKSLSNESEVKPVLVGSYDLLPILDINAQTARRCSPIHISRYHRDVESDCAEFASIVSKFCRLMPLENPPELLGYCTELMRACVGLPGMLKETLQRALNYALCEGRWIESCLERALPTKNVSTAVLRECLEGEKGLQNWESGTGVFLDFNDGSDREAA